MSPKYKNIIESLPSRRLAVIGDSMLDRFLWGRVDRISPEAPVPVVRLESETTKLGGAANVAANRQLVNIIELLRQLQVLVLGKNDEVDATLADIVRRLLHERYCIKLLSSILPTLKAVMNQLAQLSETEFARPYYEAIKEAVITSINALYKSGGSQIEIPAT